MDQFDSLLEAFEELIDARDDMWEEEKYSNYRQMIKIKEERLTPAREKVKTLLHEIIQENVRSELNRHKLLEHGYYFNETPLF